MSCPRCGLPDIHRGDGDGIGSCDCRRCDCCGCGPDECYCGRDFDDMYDDPDEPYDPLCNDTGCDYRQARLERKAYDELDAAIAAVKAGLGVETMPAGELAPLLPGHLRQPFWARAVERYLAQRLAELDDVEPEPRIIRQPVSTVRTVLDGPAGAS